MNKENKTALNVLKKLLNGKGKSGNYILALVIIVACAAVLIKAGVVPDFVGVGNIGGNEPANSYVDSFEVHFIDVGQGDCTLVKCDGKTLLIDAGENGHEEKVATYLRSEGIDTLDFILCSHQHSDHMGGLPETVTEFGVETVIMPRLTEKQTPTNKTYTAFLNALKQSGASVKAAVPGDKYTLGSAEFEILGPVSDDAEDLNNMSAVMMLTYKDKKFLFTGDAEKEEELEILATDCDLKCDVLKVGHHGSKTSSSKEFLSAASPDICVIQCGRDNDYGHPHKQALDRLKKYTSEIYRTDICGDIVIACENGELSVNYEG